MRNRFFERALLTSVFTVVLFGGASFLHAQENTAASQIRTLLSEDSYAKKMSVEEREELIENILPIIESQKINPASLTFVGIIELLFIGAQQQRSPEVVLANMPPSSGDDASLPAQGGDTVSPESCFDYYTFGSVQADVHPSVRGAVAGTPITFSGFLHNDNPYPIVEGSLYVKVFRVSETRKNANGPAVVDQFFALDDIRLQPGASVPVKFVWNIPAHAESGDYELATFFTTSRKFNLLGLSFTDDVVGNKAHFSVESEVQGGVFFEKNGVRVDAAPYVFAAFPPRVDEKKPIVISAPIKNTTNREARVSVTWKLYRWDAQRHTNLIDEHTETYTLKSAERRVLEFVAKDSAHPVYLVEGILEFKDAKSFVNIRFVRERHDALRLNFPSVMHYPLVQGVPNTMFSCAHNTGSSYRVPGGTIELILTDASGEVIHSSVYEGDITGPMMVAQSHFVPKDSYDTFTLTARLLHNGALVEEESIAYVCTEFGLAGCLPQGGGGMSTFKDVSGEEILSFVEEKKGFILIPVVGLFLFFLFIFIRSRQKINF